MCICVWCVYVCVLNLSGDMFRSDTVFIILRRLETTYLIGIYVFIIHHGTEFYKTRSSSSLTFAMKPKGFKNVLISAVLLFCVSQKYLKKLAGIIIIIIINCKWVCTQWLCHSKSFHGSKLRADNIAPTSQFRAFDMFLLMTKILDFVMLG